METKIVGSDTQTRPYYSKAEALGKAALIGITIIAYVFAIFGIWMLTRTPVQFRAQVLTGVFMSLSLILTGACFYVFRKNERISPPSEKPQLKTETEKKSSPAQPPFMIQTAVTTRNVAARIEYDLNGTVADLRTRIGAVTGKTNAIIAVDYEVLEGNNVSLRAQGVRETSFFNVFETEENFITVTVNGNKRKFQFGLADKAMNLKYCLSLRTLAPLNLITLRDGSGAEIPNYMEIKSSIQSDVVAELPKSEASLTVKYKSKTFELPYYAGETSEALNLRIFFLTGARLRVPNFHELCPGYVIEFPEGY